MGQLEKSKDETVTHLPTASVAVFQTCKDDIAEKKRVVPT